LKQKPADKFLKNGTVMAKQRTLEGSFDIPSDQDLRNLIVDSIPETAGLVSLKGFKMDLSANREFRKFFFAARCECKTSALLSVEIAEDKKLEEVKKVLPSLINKLVDQSKVFYNMSCDLHTKMRFGRMMAREK